MAKQPSERGKRRVWWYLGVTAAVVCVVGGVLTVGFLILVSVAMNSWASNK